MNYFDWRFFALGSAFFAALTAIFGKLGVNHLNSNLATFIRTIVILFITALFITLKQEWKIEQNLDNKSILFLILSGITTGISWLFYYHALKIGQASKVAPVDKLSVALVIVLSSVFLNESIDKKTLIGGALIVTGSIILTL